MKPFIVAFTLARALDVTSTCAVLAQGGRELNPFLPGTCGKQAAVQAAVASAQTWGLVRLSREHPKLAKGLAVAMTALSVGVAAHNLHQLK